MSIDHAAPGAAAHDGGETRDAASSDQWRSLLAQFGAEIATPLADAIERVTTLDESGRIDRRGLRALRDELESARRRAMLAQQIARLGGRSFRPTPEALDLRQTIESLLTYRTRELEVRGVHVETELRPARVVTDAALLFALVNAAVDWASERDLKRLEIELDGAPAPERASLRIRYEEHPPSEPRPPGTEPVGDSLTAHLIRALARVLELPTRLERDIGRGELAIEFPPAPSTSIKVDDGFAPSANSRPLEGSQVLVVVSRRDLRVDVREALRPMGLLVDFVHAVAEAEDFCQESVPHAIIYESALAGPRFSLLRDSLLAEVPTLAFVEIVEGESDFEPSGFGGSAVARIGRETLSSTLPSALMFEMSRGL